MKGAHRLPHKTIGWRHVRIIWMKNCVGRKKAQHRKGTGMMRLCSLLAGVGKDVGLILGCRLECKEC